MEFVLTLVLTFVVILIVMWVFIRWGAPVYRLDKSNVVALLELILAGEANESDWHVFVGIPMRHDETLFAIQQRCSEIAETEYLGGAKVMFTEKGLQALMVILNELKENGGVGE